MDEEKPQLNFKDKKIVYDLDYHENKFGNWIKDEELYNLKGEYAKRKYFAPYFKDGFKVFEFGCGIGQNISWIKDACGYYINKKIYPLF